MTEPEKTMDWKTIIGAITIIIMAAILAFGISQKEHRPNDTGEFELGDVKASVQLESNLGGTWGISDNYYTSARIRFEDSASYDIEYSDAYRDGTVKSTHYNLEYEKAPWMRSNHLSIQLEANLGDYYIKITNLERNTIQTLNFTIDAEYNLEVNP